MNARTVLLTLAAACASPAMLRAEPLIACGGGEVRLYETAAPKAPLWVWRASDEHGLPPRFREGLLTKIDDCKPVLDGRAILLAASTGGVAVVDRLTGRARFWAVAPQAHSAEMLPGDRVVVAAAIAPESNRLIVFDLATPEREVFSAPLPSAHGVLWDARRQRLFAVGFSELRAYALEDWTGAKPALRPVAAWTLPGEQSGHDLSPAGDGDPIVTTTDNVWRFSPDAGVFAPFAPLAGRRQVKAVSVSRRTGRIAFQQPTEQWWSHAARLAGPEGQVETPGLNLYKVRWDQGPAVGAGRTADRGATSSRSAR